MHSFTTGGFICVCLILLALGFILGWYPTKVHYENKIKLISPDWRKIVKKAIDKATKDKTAKTLEKK